MTTYVMIHGGAHGAWCWEPLLSRLNAPILAIDLPGRGKHPAPLESQTYASFVASAEADIRASKLRDIILVAHSMGGMTAIGLMERIPDRIRQVIFIASPVPPHGHSIGDLMQRRLGHAAQAQDANNALKSGVANTGIADMLFHDLSEANAAYCMSRITAESMAVFNEPVSLMGLEHRLPLTYVKTLKDRGLPLPLQEDSISRIPGVREVALDTGHTAMFADPDGLARIIIGSRTAIP